MDQDISTTSSTDVIQLSKKAWPAYVPTVLWTLFILMFVPFLWSFNTFDGIALLLVAIVLFILSILHIYSYRLYSDADGVWVYSGALPWNKGISGVKWRDLDEAVFTPSLLSWLFKSYSVCIRHRYTKSSEILLTNMKQGQQTVQIINENHQELVRANALS